AFDLAAGSARGMRGAALLEERGERGARSVSAPLAPSTNRAMKPPFAQRRLSKATRFHTAYTRLQLSSRFARSVGRAPGTEVAALPRRGRSAQHPSGPPQPACPMFRKLTPVQPPALTTPHPQPGAAYAGGWF